MPVIVARLPSSMKTFAAPAVVDEFSGARLQAREAVGLDRAGSRNPAGNGCHP